MAHSRAPNSLSAIDVCTDLHVAAHDELLEVAIFGVVSTHLWSTHLNLYQQAIKGFFS